MFYAHFPVKIMYNAIKKRYQKETLKHFMCYRGAKLANTEMTSLKSNVGKYIQMLGFLSTSLSKEVAERFVTDIYRTDNSVII